MSNCHGQNVNKKNPHTHKRQIDVSRGNLSMDATPKVYYYYACFNVKIIARNLLSLLYKLLQLFHYKKIKVIIKSVSKVISLTCASLIPKILY